ncbi:MAG: EamA family transporter [bacterium]
MQTFILLFSVTACYAAYNLLVKVSSGYSDPTTTPILATISLQLAALSVSLIYLIYLLRQPLKIVLPGQAYGWAIAAGVCIGLAEVMYFYLFRGVAGEKPMTASTAIPFVVGGTIVIALAVSNFIFRESLNPGQWIGVGLTFAGMSMLVFSSTR